MLISKDAVVGQLRQSGESDLAARLEVGVDSIEFLLGALFVTKAFGDAESMGDGWRGVQTLVAAGVQTNLDKVGLDPELAWDIYLVFLCPDPVPDALRLEIEYDKFCCKKYVLMTHEGRSTEDAMAQGIPLLCKWMGTGAPDGVHPGISSQAIAQRLAAGHGTHLAEALRSDPAFATIAAADLVNRLVAATAR